MIFNTDGLILTEQNVGESDRLVTVLTKKYGIIRAFVKGAKSIKNKNLSSTQALCFAEMNIFKGQDKYIINEAQCKEMFINVRNNIDRLALAQYFCEIAMFLAPQEEYADEYLKLLLNSLYFLNEGNRNPLILKGVVEMRMACISGYMPNIVCCKKCGIYESEVMYYNHIDNDLYCCECAKNHNLINYNVNPLVLTPNILYALRYTVYSDLNKVFSFNLLGETLKEYSQVCEIYLLSIIDKDLKALKFYKQISSN